MFVRDDSGEYDNTTEHAVGRWLDAIDAIQPTRVHVYTIARPPTSDRVARVPARRLREIGERVRALGIPVEVFATGAL
jgi:hypothetical protein